MDTLAHLIGRLVDVLLAPFDYLPEWLGILAFSIVSGVAILWVFGRLTNQPKLQAARDRMAASIYEIRIFPDSPARIVRSQLRLVVASLVYTLYTLPPLVVMSAPLALVFVHMEARHGFGLLDAHAQVLLRATLAPGVDPREVHVVPSPAVEITAPSVFDASTRAMYFRLHLAAGASSIEVAAGDRTAQKAVTTTPGARFVSPERASGLRSLIAVGHEEPLPSGGPFEQLVVQHPARSVRMLLSTPWWVHWLVISTVSALMARKRLGVVI